MSKRRCPFEFDLCPQMKIHVGEKEVAATNEKSMHSIYEKTLMTLKEGSKFFSLGSKNAQGQNKARSSDLCGCCCIIDYNQPSRCNYCDQVMCFQCLVQCTKCSGSFCQNCSLTLYDEDEQNICLSCYK